MPLLLKILKIPAFLLGTLSLALANTLSLALASALSLAASTAPAMADELQLFPWRAEYRASYKTGIPIKASAVRELKQRSDGTWHYNFDVDSMFLDVLENSTIRWQDNVVIPVQYHYLRSGWTKKREAQLDFDWTKNKVRNDVQNKPWTMDIPEGAQDKLSYQLQLHMDLIAGKTQMHYKVADGGILKDFEFAVKGEEVLETKLGKITTLYVDKLRQPDSKRFTRLWFAKEWDYLLVKMIQKEEDGEVYEINLVKAQVRGKEIK